MQRAISDEHALVYAFGERWGPAAVDQVVGQLAGPLAGGQLAAGRLLCVRLYRRYARLVTGI